MRLNVSHDVLLRQRNLYWIEGRSPQVPAETSQNVTAMIYIGHLGSGLTRHASKWGQVLHLACALCSGRP